jgi:hypothetical protein
MNVKENSQRFFRGHQNEVAVLCVSSQGEMVATAEIANKPKIIVWN